MADCKVVNAKMVSAIGNIKQYSTSYANAGTKLMEDLYAAIAPMEGATKDAIDAFFKNSVNDFVITDLPGAINGLGELLEANRKNFEDVDQQIADSISGG